MQIVVLFPCQDSEVLGVVVIRIPVFVVYFKSVNTALLSGLVRFRAPTPDDSFSFFFG